MTLTPAHRRTAATQSPADGTRSALTGGEHRPAIAPTPRFTRPVITRAAAGVGLPAPNPYSRASSRLRIAHMT